MANFELRQVGGDLLQVVDTSSGLRVTFTRHEYNNTATVAIDPGKPAATMSAAQIGASLAKISEWMAGSHYLDAMHAPTKSSELSARIVSQALANGSSVDEISKRSGLKPGVIARTLEGRSTPRGDQLARIVCACGYALEIVDPASRSGFTPPPLHFDPTEPED